jgi:hypothetical protein
MSAAEIAVALDHTRFEGRSRCCRRQLHGRTLVLCDRQSERKRRLALP